MNANTAVELFHLLFLHQLEDKLDRGLYALKGGCNLRFFFKSIRYSEDIDFDVTTIAKTTLENKVNKILESRDFKKILQINKIDILKSTAVKQTDTTQRWKLSLQTPNSSLPIPTKIEFSRRKMDKGVSFEAIDSSIIHQHHLYPIMCNHYVREAAFSQKIDALINRTETQARDIFDLKLLLDQGVDPKMLPKELKIKLGTAIQNVTLIRYEHFKGQVIAYLMEEYKTYYDSKEKWIEIQKQLIDALERQ